MSEPKKYYVSHNQQQLGPFPVEQIVDMVQSQKLSVMDYVFNEEKQDWCTLVDFPPVMEEMKKIKPSAPPKPSAPNSNPADAKETPPSLDEPIHPKVNNNEFATSEWYVLKGENKFGPFSYAEIVKMLQQKLVFEFDFAWKPNMENWQRIAELEAFKYDNIKKLKNEELPDLDEAFFRRRHRRTNYGGTVIIHDEKKLWKGKGVEISSGGAGVIMENAMVIPGQKLFLHFKPGDGVPPFNARCEVVSKKYVDGIKDKNTPIRYGLKFIDLNEDAAKFLKEFTQDPSKEAA